MKTFCVILALFASLSHAAEHNLAVDLAKQVLRDTPRVTSAKSGLMVEHPGEVLAFNIVYRQPDAPEIFKAIFLQSRSAGKVFALVGLYLKKDPDFEKLKTDFLSASQETIECMYGCKGSTDNDAKQVLKSWLEGIPKDLWYTKIVITEKQ